MLAIIRIKILNWFRELLGINANYDLIRCLQRDNSELVSKMIELRGALENVDQKVRDKIQELDSLAKMDIDGHHRGQNSVILTGVFRGRGYIQFYDVSDSEFRYLVEDFRQRRRHSMVRNIDVHPQFGGSFGI